MEELEDEVTESVNRIQGLYIAAKDGVRHTSTVRSRQHKFFAHN